MTCSRRMGLVALILILGGMAAVWVGRWKNDVTQVPRNVVFIGIDTLRADHVGCYGYQKDITPHLDAAAREGVLFETCTAQAPWTLPSFSSAFTSLYPSQHGAQIRKELRSLNKDLPSALRDVPTLTAILKAHGLRTQAFVANPYTACGLERDFDDFQYRWGGATNVTEAGMAFLEQHGQDPFFLYLHYIDPHEHRKLMPEPYGKALTPPDTYAKMIGADRPRIGQIIDQFGFDLYDPRIVFTDEQIGRVLDELKARDLWTNTLVVILSDHGEEFRDHVEEHRKLGYDPRGIYGVGHGHSLYQEIVNAVLILSGGVVPAGRRVAGTVRLIDIMPTVLDCMRIRARLRMEGRSLISAIRTGQAGDRPSFSEGIAYGYDKQSLRVGKWKYIHSAYHDVEELFDLDEDPGEKINLIDQEPRQAAVMRRRIRTFMGKELAGKEPPGDRIPTAEEARIP